ncbi:hypothetical protein Hanom_Chr16g01453141 [Helianthus anomalus]
MNQSQDVRFRMEVGVGDLPLWFGFRFDSQSRSNMVKQSAVQARVNSVKPEPTWVNRVKPGQLGANRVDSVNTRLNRFRFWSTVVNLGQRSNTVRFGQFHSTQDAVKFNRRGIANYLVIDFYLYATELDPIRLNISLVLIL